MLLFGKQRNLVEKKIDEVCRVGDEVVIKAQAYDDEWVKVEIDEEEIISYLESKNPGATN